MFARLYQFQLKPDKVDEAIKIFRESALPTVKEEKRLNSDSILIINRNTGKGATIIFFDSKEDMLATEKSGWPQ